MNLLLLSLGLGAVPQFLKRAGSIAFVPTAGIPYEQPTFVERDRRLFKEMEFKLVELDIATASRKVIGSTLAEVDAVFVSGGNVFFLMQAIWQSGFGEEVRRFIKSGGLYIGA